jgi:hypothetical protein
MSRARRGWRGRIGAVAAVAAACSVTAAAGGCGGVRAADLFVVSRTGPAPGQRLTLLVNEEGGVHCNGAMRHLSDPQLVQARALQEELHGPASAGMHLPAGPGSVFGYSVRDEAGTVTFADNSAGKPHVLSELALFVEQVATQVCGLPQ